MSKPQIIGAACVQTSDPFTPVECIQFAGSSPMSKRSAQLLVSGDVDYDTMKFLAAEVAQVIKDMSEEDFDRLHEDEYTAIKSEFEDLKKRDASPAEFAGLFQRNQKHRDDLFMKLESLRGDNHE